MKRNKHHGLNVEFDGLCMDFGHVSLNKKKEFLCGDCYKIEENDKDHVLVLSDGLGSGVKANILSTLTATMLSTMIINQVELDEAVRASGKNASCVQCEKSGICHLYSAEFSGETGKPLSV